MTYIVAAFVALFLGSLALGVLWNLLLFKRAYEEASGEFRLENSKFPIGLSAIVLNTAAMMLAFSVAYPAGAPTAIWAVGIMLVVWTPHFVATMATAAKFAVADRPKYLALELAFDVMNAVVLGLILRAIYTAFH